MSGSALLPDGLVLGRPARLLQRTSILLPGGSTEKLMDQAVEVLGAGLRRSSLCARLDSPLMRGLSRTPVGRLMSHGIAERGRCSMASTLLRPDVRIRVLVLRDLKDERT